MIMPFVFLCFIIAVVIYGVFYLLRVIRKLRRANDILSRLNKELGGPATFDGPMEGIRRDSERFVND